MSPVGRFHIGGHKTTKFVPGSYKAAVWCVLANAAPSRQKSLNHLVVALPSIPGMAQMNVGLRTVSVVLPECLCTFRPVENLKVSFPFPSSQ